MEQQLKEAYDKFVASQDKLYRAQRKGLISYFEAKDKAMENIAEFKSECAHIVFDYFSNKQ